MDNNAMFKLTYGLFVITAKCGEKDNGCITNTAGQVTVTPNRISLAVNKLNYTHDMIVESGEFNVSIISEKADFELFKHFGFQSGRDVNKFESFSDCERAENGIYYITRGINSYISAKVVASYDLGTHTMVIADVTDAEILDTASSCTYTYYQEHIKGKPAPQEKKSKGFVCKICGYVYEGDVLPEDFICPLCKHGAADFEPL